MGEIFLQLKKTRHKSRNEKKTRHKNRNEKKNSAQKSQLRKKR